MSRTVEPMSRTQRDLQRLDGRRGPPSKRAVTWGDIDALLAEIATRSQASGGKFTKAIGAGEDIKFEDILGELTVDKIVSPVIGAPTGLTITSTVNEETGISYVYFDWDDVEGAAGYQLGISLEGGGEFIVSAPSSFFQNSVIAGQTIEARVRSINALNVPGAWSALETHVAQGDTIPPEVPGNVTIEAAFNGFWFKWDKSTAVDIARYEVYESASATPAPTALTAPTFTSASPLFFRGAVGDAVTRHYWIRSVDYSENASAWSARVSATTLLINADDLGDNVIIARHLTTGELITLSAQIKNAIITDAKIANLSAAKLTAGTAIANSILVNGQALGTIQQNADNPAARINAASTNIQPGKITLTGAATLLDWTATADRTKIDGGRIFTNSITAAAINTTSLAADSAFITNLTSTGTSFMNQLLVRTANIDNLAVTEGKIGSLAVTTLKIGGNAATTADFDQYNPSLSSANFISGAGFGTAFSVCNGLVSIPNGVTADIFVALNLRQGYLSTPTQWGYRIRRVDGPTVINLTTRTGMTATADFPVITYLTSYTNSSGSSRLIGIIGQWYGQNSNIELQDATLSIVVRYK